MAGDDLDGFILDVQRSTGLTPARVRRLVERVLGALDAVLLDYELEAVRRNVPEGLRAVIPSAGEAPLSVARLLARVQRAEAVRLPVARERTLVVTRLLGRALSPDLAARWTRDLPAPTAALFFTTVDAPFIDAPAPRPPPPARSPAAPTLATGRPGSTHPVSEARPEVAQRHSVVRADDPHADTRLSSTRGLTQERLHETLAEGIDGSERPLRGR